MTCVFAYSAAETSLLMKIIRKGLVESKQDLEIQRKDPNSPLYSVKTFEALHLWVGSWVSSQTLSHIHVSLQEAGVTKGSLRHGIQCSFKNSGNSRSALEIFFYSNKIGIYQETALPTLLADPPQNMIAQSQSGTGKTAAFVLAMLSRVDPKKDYPQVGQPVRIHWRVAPLRSCSLLQVLCLSPTYELAIQTGEVAARMAQFCPEIKLKYAVRGEEGEPECSTLLKALTRFHFSWEREAHRSHHYWNAGKSHGLGY